MKNETIIFISLSRNENTTLEGREFPPAEVIDTVDEIFISEGKAERNRLIRYKPGEKSVFLDEQSGQYDKDGKIKKYGSIVMTNGILAVDGREKLLLKYLRMCNANIASEYRMPGKTAIFMERDVEVEAEVYLEEEKADRELLNMIDNMSPSELQAQSLILGDTRADKKKTAEVRRDLIIAAKSDPKRFREKLNDVNSTRKVHVLTALKDGYIKYDKSTNTITWEDGKEITKCPIGKDPSDYLVELSFLPAYEKVYAAIELRKPLRTIKLKSNTKNETDRELVETAMEAAIFDKKGLWYRLERNGELQNIGRGVSEIVNKIEFDDELKELIRKRVYALEPAE